MVPSKNNLYYYNISRKPWTEKKSNREVMEIGGYKKSLLKTIIKRQLQFFGHINRADGLEKQILSGKICGTKAEEENAQNTQTV